MFSRLSIWLKIAHVALLDQFDAKFYGHFYRDLRGVKSRIALLQHYAQYGAAECRAINLEQAQLDASRKFPALPLDFDLATYKTLNKDLRNFFTFDWEYLLHYVEFGRNEGRIYKTPDPLSVPTQAPRATIYALRADGVGTRLLTILHAQILAQELGCDFKVIWPPLDGVL